MLSVPDFDQDGKADNITFMIKRIKVYTPEALKDKSYRFPGNYGVEKFLEIFSGTKTLFLFLAHFLLVLSIVVASDEGNQWEDISH